MLEFADARVGTFEDNAGPLLRGENFTQNGADVVACAAVGEKLQGIGRIVGTGW